MSSATLLPPIDNARAPLVEIRQISLETYRACVMGHPDNAGISGPELERWVADNYARQTRILRTLHPHTDASALVAALSIEAAREELVRYPQAALVGAATVVVEMDETPPGGLGDLLASCAAELGLSDSDRQVLQDPEAMGLIGCLRDDLVETLVARVTFFVKQSTSAT